MWSEAEDQILIRLVNIHGTEKWAKLARLLNDELAENPISNQDTSELQIMVERNGKQCRERWLNALDPEINKGHWSIQNDIEFLKKWLRIGNRWKEIADKISGRTESQVKNRFKLLLRHFGIEKYKTDHKVLKLKI